MTYFNEDFELESRRIENGIFSEELNEEIFENEKELPIELILKSVDEMEKVNDLPF